MLSLFTSSEMSACSLPQQIQCAISQHPLRRPCLRCDTPMHGIVSRRIRKHSALQVRRARRLVWLRQLKTLIGLTFVVNLLVSMMLADTTVLDSRSQTSRVLRGVSPSLGSWLWPLSLCQRVQKLDRRLWRQVLVVVITDLHHCLSQLMHKDQCLS